MSFSPSLLWYSSRLPRHLRITVHGILADYQLHLFILLEEVDKPHLIISNIVFVRYYLVNQLEEESYSPYRSSIRKKLDLNLEELASIVERCHSGQIGVNAKYEKCYAKVICVIFRKKSLQFSTNTSFVGGKFFKGGAIFLALEIF